MDESRIRFNDCFFAEPLPFANWTPPGCASLYAILVTDVNWAPRPFQPLYFGEFGNNTSLTAVQREVTNLMPAPRRESLFVAVLPLPFSTTGQRLMLRNELIWAYNPPCQVKTSQSQPAELVATLEELERRHQEHTAELHLLFASARGFMSPKLPPRRRIGFMPLDGGLDSQDHTNRKLADTLA
jgi:hypothetical protein